MTITATEPLVSGPYNGNGITDVFDFDFRIFAETELQVYLRTALGAELIRTLGVDYTVSPAGGVYPAAGGTVNMVTPPATGEQLLILPDITQSQDRPYSSQSSITLQEVEDSLDKLTAICRQLYERSLRAVTVSAFNPGDLDALLNNIDAIIALEDEIVAITASLDEINALAAVDTEIAALAPYTAQLATVAASIASLITVAANIASVNTTAGNIASVNNVSANMPSILAVDPSIYDKYNPVHNGTFDIWQRGLTTSVNNAFAADRWRNLFLGGTSTQAIVNNTGHTKFGRTTPYYFFQQAVVGAAGATDFAGMRQDIENARTLAGETITIMGWARRTAGAGNLAVELEQNFGTGGSPSANVTQYAGQIALTGSWAPFALTVTVPAITAKTFGTNFDDRLALTIWASAGSSYNARTGSLGVQTLTFQLWGLHILPGTHGVGMVANYTPRSYHEELALCQRFYEITRGFAQSGSGGFNGNRVLFATTKRAIPTCAFVIAAGSTWTGTTLFDPTASGVSMNGNATAAAGNVTIDITANAEY